MSDDMDKVIEQIQKLLNLAARNPNEFEAASAASKAQELLTRYNLDTAAVEKASGGSGKREQLEVEGGFYRYQRELWKAIAALNFCWHWTQDKYVKFEKPRMTARAGYRTGKTYKRHVLIGRTVNVRTTIGMAQYLESVIERLTRERIQADERHRLGNWAVSYRKGIADRIMEKVEDRRTQMEADEAARLRAAQHEAERSGTSTATALTIADVKTSEYIGNYDFQHGEGSWVKKKMQEAEAQKRRQEAEESYTRWAAANPVEAKAKADKEEEESRKYWSKRSRWRGDSTERDNRDMSAYYSGYDAAKNVSIDPQMDTGGKVAGRLK